MSFRIDHQLLGAATSSRDVDALIEYVLADASSKGASTHGILVPPVFARRAVDALRGRVRVASVAGYPLGLSKPTVKAIEATSLAKDGVDAIEITPLLANIVDGDFDALRDELLEIVRGTRAARATTALHVRLDLKALGDVDWPAVGSAIARGACDGVVLEHASLQQCLAAARALEPSRLELKLVRPLDNAANDLAEQAIPAGVTLGLPFSA